MTNNLNKIKQEANYKFSNACLQNLKLYNYIGLKYQKFIELMYFIVYWLFLLSFIQAGLIRTYQSTQILKDIATFTNSLTGQIKLAHCFYQNITGLTKVGVFDPENSYSETSMSFAISITEIEFDKTDSNIIYGIGNKYIFEINFSTLTYQSFATDGQSLTSIRKTHHNSTISHVVGTNRKRIYFKNANGWSFSEQNGKIFDSRITYLSTFSDTHVVYLTKENCYLYNIQTGQNFKIFPDNQNFYKTLIVTKITDQLGKLYELRFIITYDSEVIVSLCSSLFDCQHQSQVFLIKNLFYYNADAKTVINSNGTQYIYLVLRIGSSLQAYKFQITSTAGLLRTLIINYQMMTKNRTSEFVEIYNHTQTNFRIFIGNLLFLRQRPADQWGYPYSYLPPCSFGFFDFNSSFCQLCSVGCYKCSDFTTCIQCLNGFYLNEAKCYSCLNQGCLHCLDSQTCIQCHPQFGLNTTKMYCWPCNLYYTNCLTCHVNQTNDIICQSCQSDAFLFNEYCSSCNKAMIGCIACQDNITCYECQQNFTLILANSSCLCQLPHILNPILNQCILCSIANCLYCDLPNYCLLCEINYQNINGLCFICNITGCLKCSSNNICSLCDDNYTLINGVCIYCPIQGCFYCKSQNNCSLCKQNENRFLQNGLCPVCNIKNCQKCLTSSQCSKCKQGSISEQNVCSQQIYHSFRNKLFQCEGIFIDKVGVNQIQIQLQFNRQYMLLDDPNNCISMFFNGQPTNFQIIQMTSKQIKLIFKFSQSWVNPKLIVELNKEKLVSIEKYYLYRNIFTHQYFRLTFIDEQKQSIIEMLAKAAQLMGRVLKIAVPSLIIFGFLSLLINLIQALQIICVFYSIGFQLPQNFRVLISSLLNIQINGLFPFDVPNPFSDIQINTIIPEQLQIIEININYLDAHFQDITVFLLIVLINLVIGKGLVLLLPQGYIRSFLQKKYGRKNYDTLIVQFQSFCFIMLFTATIIMKNIHATTFFLSLNNFICLLFVGICIIVLVGHYINVALFIQPNSYQIIQNSFNIFDKNKSNSISILTYKLFFYGFICCSINLLHFYLYITCTITGGFILLIIYIKADIFENKLLKCLHIANCCFFLLYFTYFVVMKIDQIVYLFDDQKVWLAGYVGIGLIAMIIFIELIVIVIQLIKMIINICPYEQKINLPAQNFNSQQSSMQQSSQVSNSNIFKNLSVNMKRSKAILQQFSTKQKNNITKIQVNWMKRIKKPMLQHQIYMLDNEQMQKKSNIFNKIKIKQNSCYQMKKQ